MTPHQFIGLAARLFAVWLFLAGLTAALMVITNGEPTPDGMAPVRLGAAALYLLEALFLWFFPMSIAQGLLPRTRFVDTLRVPSLQALTVAFIVLGATLIVFRALPDLVSFLTAAVTFMANGQPITAVGPDRGYEGVLGFAELVVGFVMIRKATAFTLWALPSPGA